MMVLGRKVAIMPENDITALYDKLMEKISFRSYVVSIPCCDCGEDLVNLPKGHVHRCGESKNV